MDINDDSFESSYSPKKGQKLNSLVVMTALSLVLGLVAAFGIWEYLNKTQEKVEKLNVTKSVVVASREIKSGTKITIDDITTMSYPVESLPKKYFTKPQVFIGRIAKNNISTDEFITFDNFYEAGARGGITSVIPKGLRAITIRVNDITGVGGFIYPGDRVDILSVVDSGKKGELLSKTILQNVLVVASGEQILDENNSPNPAAAAAPKGVAQITLALDLINAEKLALATSKSDVRLVLRPFGDRDEQDDLGVLTSDVYGYLSHEPEAPVTIAHERSSQPPKKSIDIILGSYRTAVYF